MRTHALFLMLFIATTLCAQSIVNTELILKDIDSVSVFKIAIDGDLKYGNINLIELNNQLSFGRKMGQNLIRFSISQEYLTEDDELLANDWVGQLRMNHFFDRNSVFGFVQIQNAISLNLKSRYLLGGGYRFRLTRTSQSLSNYLDSSIGIFREVESYQQINNDKLTIKNLRYSLNVFSNFKIAKAISLNSSVYYQLNHSNLKDFRAYIEPRLYYNIDNFGIYFTNRFRYHSTPYVSIKKSDLEFLFGIELTL